MIEARPAPPGPGPLGRLRARLFATPLDATVSLVMGSLALWALAAVLDWALLGAVWEAERAEACQSAEGACWAVIDARGRLILFGLYPREEHWRSGLACLVAMATMALSCLPAMWGGARLAALWLAGFGAFVLLMRGGALGLASVTTEQWGGLSLTHFIFCAVVVMGMPLAVGLALARRARLPVVARLAGLLIDTVRSLPLLTILFAAAVVAPLLVPDWAQGDKLMRVTLAYAVFYACYQAEILRAGLQSLPPGQAEAARALGLPAWVVQVRVLLPQAFRVSLPATINQVVIAFKETSIVTIVGFFEIMASANAALGTGEWNRYHVEVYVFVALVYFIFVFGLSRYGGWLEARVRLGRR